MILTGMKLYAAIGIAGAMALAGAYQTGVNAERGRGRAAQLQVELNTLKLDRRLGDQALKSALDKAKTLDAIDKKQQEELDALRTALAARPETDRCPVSDSDLKLLFE